MNSLPRNWRIDYRLKPIIPTSHDWQSFRFVAGTRDRYAACVCGGGVFDTFDNRFLSPHVDSRTGRVRYRLNANDPATGKLDAVKYVFYSRIILTLVHGARSLNHQGHHIDGDRRHDHHKNLSWVSPRANKRMAAEHKSRTGYDNPNAKMESAKLAEFIRDHDAEMRMHGRVDLKPYAAKYDVTARQLRRYVTEKSRTEEVRGFRELRRKAEDQRRREEYERTRNRHSFSHSDEDEAPFYRQ